MLQVAEGYWYYSMDRVNCGTQLKLTSILSGAMFVLLAYRYLNSENSPAPKFLHYLGDCSFGIYFSHLAVMFLLKHIPYYEKYVVYPMNAIITIIVTILFIIVGRRILGKHSKYIAI